MMSTLPSAWGRSESSSPCPQKSGSKEASNSDGDEEASSSADDEEPESPPKRRRFDEDEEVNCFDIPTTRARTARALGIAAAPKSRRNLSSTSSSAKTTTVEVRSSTSVPAKRKASPVRRVSMTRVVEQDKTEPYNEDLLYSPILGNPLHIGTGSLRPWVIPKPSDFPGSKPPPPTPSQPPVAKPCNICNAPHIEAYYRYCPCGHQACKWCFYTAWEYAQIRASALFTEKVSELSADVPCGVCKAVVDELTVETKGERWIVAGKIAHPGVRLGSAKRRKSGL
jgi:hypothetical protein